MPSRLAEAGGHAGQRGSPRHLARSQAVSFGLVRGPSRTLTFYIASVSTVYGFESVRKEGSRGSPAPPHLTFTIASAGSRCPELVRARRRFLRWSGPAAYNAPEAGEGAAGQRLWPIHHPL